LAARSGYALDSELRRAGLIALTLWTAIAAAATPDGLSARLVEIQPQRELRMVRAPIPTEADLRKAAEGAVVTQLLSASAGSRTYGVAVVPLSIGAFWAALNDETRHPGYTAIGYSELLKGRACASGRRVLQFLPVPMLSDRWWIGVLTKNTNLMQASGGALRELTWQSSIDPAEVTTDSGKKILAQAEPIGFSKGAWFLVALGERETYVEYYLHSDPGGSIPSGIAAKFATRGVRETIGAIQRFAREARPACPVE
jgi:hypothetical protein